MGRSVIANLGLQQCGSAYGRSERDCPAHGAERPPMLDYGDVCGMMEQLRRRFVKNEGKKSVCERERARARERLLLDECYLSLTQQCTEGGV